MKGAFVWDEWVHLQLTASVLLLTCSSAAPFSLFCSWLLFTIAHLPLQMVSLLFSNLIQILICHRKKKKKAQRKKVDCEHYTYASWTETLSAWKSNKEGNKTWWFWDQTFPDSLRSPEVRKSLSAPCFCVSALFSAQVRALCHHSWLLFCLSWNGKHMGMHDRA